MIKNIDDIKQKSDIVAIIGHFIPLEKSGPNYKACCPFHAEKGPSFSVSARKQVYHCFGCGASGDVFTFVERQMNIEFVDAVEFVAKEIGERVEYEKGRENFRQEYMAAKEAKNVLVNLLADAEKFYYHNTWAVPPFEFNSVLIDGRIYKGDTLDKFRISYAPTNALYKAAQEGRFDLGALEQAGMVQRSEQNGGYYDFFSNRTLFPLHDPNGIIVGFTGRKQPDSPEKSAKYKNSAESPLFQKSKYLYGLFQTSQAISKADLAYIVEGQHDLLTMYESGITNVVATGGTALTKHHAKLLNRYTDCAVLLFDGDDAGLKAALRGVETLAAHMSVKVCILADEQGSVKIDPCDWIRNNGVEHLRAHIEAKTTDGVIWAIMREWAANDLDRQQRAINTAARILAALSLLKRDMYIRELATKGKMGTGMKKILEDAIDQQLADNAPASAFTREQQDQISKYGVYVSNRQYFVPIEDGKGVPISNFHIKSMLLIDGNATSERVLEIENINGLKVISRIKSDLFTDLGAFRAWVESRGHFMLKVKAEQWTAIRDMTYDTMTIAYPITVLGHHREGFYTFRNGIYDGDVFQPCNDMGVVQAGSDHYLITSSANFDNSKADDGNDKNITSTFMSYTRESGHKWTLAEWGKMMRDTYGDKAIPGMAYLAAALFRDVIYDKFTFFPHLNVFGVKGSGKNYFIESIMSVFGRVEAPVDLTSATDKALPRVMAGVRNSIVWFDEYKNECDPNIISVLRGAYGASGRTTAEKSMDNNTRRFQPRSGIIISGEHRPTKDIALYSRCCAVETTSSSFSSDQTRVAERLKEVEQSGVLINIAMQLLKYRDQVQLNFYNKFREVRDGLLGLTEGKQIESRIVANWAIVATIGEVLRDAGEAIPWQLNEMLDLAMERIVYQSSVVTSEDHLANFWRIAAYLIEDNKIFHNQDIIVQQLKTFKIWGKSSREKIEYNTPDGEAAKFIFIRLTRLHPLYLQYMQMQNRSHGMQIGTLEHYITTSKWYVGKTKKKYKEDTQVCFVLRADADFPVDISYTKDINESPFDE